MTDSDFSLFTGSMDEDAVPAKRAAQAKKAAPKKTASFSIPRVAVKPRMMPLIEEEDDNQRRAVPTTRASLLMDTLKTSRMDLPLSSKQRVAAWVLNSGQSFEAHGDPEKKVQEARIAGLLPMGGGQGLRVRDEAALSEAESGQQYEEFDGEEHHGRHTAGAASSAGCLAKNALEDLKQFEESEDDEEEAEEQEEEQEEEEEEEESNSEGSPVRRKSGSGSEEEEEPAFGAHAPHSHSKPADVNLRKRLQEQIQSMMAGKPGAAPFPLAAKDGDDEGGRGLAREDSIGGDHTNHGYSDYNRGKRFRKLIKMLGSATAVATMTRFKQQTLIAVGVLVLLHVAVFTVMLILLNQLIANLLDLNSTGEPFLVIPMSAISHSYSCSSFLQHLPVDESTRSASISKAATSSIGSYLSLVSLTLKVLLIWM